jgi:hypothetical protein
VPRAGQRLLHSLAELIEELFLVADDERRQAAASQQPRIVILGRGSVHCPIGARGPIHENQRASGFALHG